MKVSVKAIRVHRGLTQSEVAEKLGVNVDRVKYLESEEGSRNMTYENLLKFCAIYDCTVDDIFLPIDFPKSEAAGQRSKGW